ncbi:MAG: hypothetical protein ABSG78_08355 [Verrucomicrobiota bacterium]
MKTLKFAFALAVAAASMAAPFWAQHRARVKLSAVENTLRQQAGEMARLSADKERLSHEAAPSLPNDQLKELLRLRNEAGRLRETVAETKTLRAALQNAGLPSPAEAPGGANYWPADQLANAGRATPESTLKTSLWALKNGDLNTVISCMGPEMRAAIENEEQNNANAAQDIEKEFKQMAAEMFSQTTGFRLVEEKATAPDEMTILLSYEGQGVAQKFRLKKAGSDWTVEDGGQPEIYEPGQRL